MTITRALIQFAVFFTIGWFTSDLQPRWEAFTLLFATILALHWFRQR